MNGITIFLRFILIFGIFQLGNLEKLAYINNKGNLEFCDTEIFNAQCQEGEVILMETAKYGRMQMGRCIDTVYGHLGCRDVVLNIADGWWIRVYGHLGCHADVLDIADGWCSGKISCQIPIPNSKFKSVSICPKDLTPYLETSYSCIAVDTGENQSCDNSPVIIPSSPTSGYIANYITIKTQKGSDACPWMIESRPGQRINITLYDFSRDNDVTAEESKVCKVYADISESTYSGKVSRVCGEQPGPRERVVFSSLANRVQIRIKSQYTQDLYYFMLRYDVLGCETPEDLPYMVKQMEDELTVSYSCQATGDIWRLVCIHNQWEGEVGNCTAVEFETTTEQAALVGIIQDAFTLSFEIAILVVIVVAVAIGLCIVICGICCVTRKRKRKPRQQQKKPVQAVTPTSKHSVPRHSGEYRKLNDLPPPPPELLKDSMCADCKDEVVSQCGSRSCDYECITAKMPSPPPSPSSLPQTDTSSLGTLSNHTGSLPHAANNTRRTQSASSYSIHNVRNSPSVGILSNTTARYYPQQNATASLGGRGGGGGRNGVTEQNGVSMTSSNSLRSPLSAGYNPRNSFEFPPPPSPEVLKNSGYMAHSPKSFASPHATPGTAHKPQKPMVDLPENDIIRYRIVEPKQQQDPFKKYGSLGNRNLLNKNAMMNNSAVITAQGGKKMGDKVHFNVEKEKEVPCEYGYHLKTGKKFKIYQPPMTPDTKSRDDRNKRQNSVTSFSPLPNQKPVNNDELSKSKTGTM